MNLYFLVEGRRTERKVYPKWLSVLVPELSQVTDFDKVEKNNYYLFSGNGFPSLMNNHLRNAVEDINNLGKYDYLVICLDAEEDTVADKRLEIYTFMKEHEIRLNSHTNFEIIVQNRCIETWFLGNPKIVKPNPTSEELRKFMTFYNVRKDDPELMGTIDDLTHAQFHEIYLKEVLAEKNLFYSKNNPSKVIEESFLKELIKRVEKTHHLPSFKYFLDFCAEIRKQIRS